MPTPTPRMPAIPARPAARSTAIVALLALLAVALSVRAPHIWPTLLREGIEPFLLLLAAYGWGAPLAAGLLPAHAPARRRMLGVALGTGVLSSTALVAGCAGWLNGGTAWALVIAGLVLALHAIRAEWRERARAAEPVADPPAIREGAIDVVLDALVGALAGGALAVGVFAACVPPGWLWADEGFGFDVLEYHLQAPREHFEAGQIRFLPHNVYASFPTQVETLYLLLMHLRGDAHAAAIPAQLLHLGFAGVFIWTCTNAVAGRAARRIALLLAATTPWVAYLGSLAYVEAALLFYAAVAADLLCRWLARLETPQRSSDLHPALAPSARNAALAVGLCGGLAGGCKYTGLVFVPAALVLSWMLLAPERVAARSRAALWIALGAALAFAPWAIRNAAFTGDPVYPFAYRLMGGAAWSPEQATQWAHGHALPEPDRAPLARLGVAWRETVSSQLFGAALWGVALLAVLTQRNRRSALLLVWAGAILVGWALLTHMPGRFLVPILVPVTFLAAGGRSASEAGDSVRRLLAHLVLPVALLGGLLNNFTLHGLLDAHDQYWAAARQTRLSAQLGRVDEALAREPLNQALAPQGTFVWLVGKANVFYVQRPLHYAVVFNRDPWLAHAGAAQDPRRVVAWLRERGVTHVLFSWAEIERLRSYGFPEWVTPDWANSLVAGGLRRLHARSDASGRLTSVLYQVLNN